MYWYLVKIMIIIDYWFLIYCIAVLALTTFLSLYHITCKDLDQVNFLMLDLGLLKLILGEFFPQILAPEGDFNGAIPCLALGA